MTTSTVVVALIGGGSGTGKTTIADGLVTSLGTDASTLLPIDAYYHHRPDVSASHGNFDVPDAIDHTLLHHHVEALVDGHAVERPCYDYRTHQRGATTVTLQARRYLVIEGLFALHWPALRAHATLSVFVDIDDEVALARRISRDTDSRGRDERIVRTEWARTVRPMYAAHVAPTRHHADLVVDGADPVELSVGTIVARLGP